MQLIKVNNAEKFSYKINQTLSKKNTSIVEAIIKNVKKNGDNAIRRYEKKFGGADISSLRISQTEIKKAFSKVPKIELDAIKLTKTRLEKTELAIKSMLKDKIIRNDGIIISKQFVPIESVGCYIPGGLAKYTSSVMMAVVPAKIAGVKRIVVVSPPNSSGKLDPLTIVAAKICGANEIYKTGGVQSIAALSYGTKTISKVDKIVGPGGAFVTSAKLLLSERTGIDMLAGPTELGIIADSFADPKYVALDLISQAEHSKDTLCYVITTSKKMAKSVNEYLTEIIPKIQRQEIVKTSLTKNGFIAICKNKSEMISLANALAPEHLQIMMKNPTSLASRITSPGLILLGNETPSSASDYVLGSNHILPTNGFGKTRGSLSVLDFMKINTQLSCNKSSLFKVSKYLKVLTKNEGLSNHYEAVRGRLE